MYHVHYTYGWKVKGVLSVDRRQARQVALAWARHLPRLQAGSRGCVVSSIGFGFCGLGDMFVPSVLGMHDV